MIPKGSRALGVILPWAHCTARTSLRAYSSKVPTVRKVLRWASSSSDPPPSTSNPVSSAPKNATPAAAGSAPVSRPGSRPAFTNAKKPAPAARIVATVKSSVKKIDYSKTVTPFIPAQRVERGDGTVVTSITPPPPTPPSCDPEEVPLSLPLLPPQSARSKGKITLVLDMDETLVYARSGIVHSRPYLEDFMQFIDGKFEVVMWTAGIQRVARYVLSRIDKTGVIEHLIYRDHRWFPPEALEEKDRLYTKKLELLGRDVDKVLVIENTPECCVDARNNCILVPDFECHSIADAYASKDNILQRLIPVLNHFTVETPQKSAHGQCPISVSEVIRTLHKEGYLETHEFVNLKSGNLGRFYHLGGPTRTMPKPPRSPSSPGAEGVGAQAPPSPPRKKDANEVKGW